MSSPETGPPPEYELVFYRTESGKEPASEFIEGLKHEKRETLTSAILEVLRNQGIAVCGTEWGKNLGKGLCEFRVRDEGIVLRLYFHPFGQKMLLLLAGWDKGRFASRLREQQAINTARKYLSDWQVANRRESKGRKGKRR